MPEVFPLLALSTAELIVSVSGEVVGARILRVEDSLNNILQISGVDLDKYIEPRVRGDSGVVDVRLINDTLVEGK